VRTIDGCRLFRLDVDRLYGRMTLPKAIMRTALMLASWLERRNGRWSLGERRDFWRGTF
jgi:hypothetical protein